MSNLFYGGKNGRGFFIGKTFKSVGDMLAALDDQSSYTEVNYGDYMLISTENLNHPDNGMLFKRGTDFNSVLTQGYYDAASQTWCGTYVELDDEGREIEIIEPISLSDSSTRPAKNYKTPSHGATYVGQIVGPSGNAPDVYVLGLTEETFQHDEEDTLIGVNGAKIDGSNKIVSVHGHKAEFSVGSGLVPGKDQPYIGYEYCTLRDVNGINSEVYVGFSIPYTSLEASATQSEYRASPTATVVQLNTNGQEYDPNGGIPLNPFHYRVDLGIPEGKAGTSIQAAYVGNNGELITQYYNPHGIEEGDFPDLDGDGDEEGDKYKIDIASDKTTVTITDSRKPMVYVTSINSFEIKNSKEETISPDEALSEYTGTTDSDFTNFLTEKGWEATILNDDSSVGNAAGLQITLNTGTIKYVLYKGGQELDFNAHSYWGESEDAANELPDTGLWFVIEQGESNV